MEFTPDRIISGEDRSYGSLVDHSRVFALVRAFPHVAFMGALLGLVAGIAAGLLGSPTYSAQLRLTLGPPAGQMALAVTPSTFDATTARNTAAQLLMDPALQRQVSQEVGHPVQTVSAAGVTDSAIVLVTETAASPRRASADLSAVVNAFEQAQKGSVAKQLELLRSRLQDDYASVSQQLAALDNQPAQTDGSTAAALAGGQDSRVQALRDQQATTEQNLARVASALVINNGGILGVGPTYAEPSPSGLSRIAEAVLGVLAGLLLALLFLLIRQANHRVLLDSEDVENTVPGLYGGRLVLTEAGPLVSRGESAAALIDLLRVESAALVAVDAPSAAGLRHVQRPDEQDEHLSQAVVPETGGPPTTGGSALGRADIRVIPAPLGPGHVAELHRADAVVLVVTTRRTMRRTLLAALTLVRQIGAPVRGVVLIDGARRYRRLGRRTVGR